MAGAKCLFLGAQALVWAEGGVDESRPQVIEEKFDYQEQRGFAWKIVGRAGKPKFNSLDYAVIAIEVARTNVSGS